MRILYFNDAWAIWGGLERVLIDKMNYLADCEGYEIFTITYNQEYHPIPYPLSPKVVHRNLNIQLYEQYRYHGVKRYYYRYKLQKLLIKRLRLEIMQIKPDVLVCPRIDLLGYILKVKGNIPLIYECHSCCKWITYDYHGLIWRIRQYFYLKRAEQVEMVIALTEGDADEWRKLTSNVCVIPNMVHLNKRETFGDCTSKSVIFVGRISKQKDIGSLLHIWGLVHRRHPDWNLHIYGRFDGEHNRILSEIKEMDANIQVHHPTSDIMEKYKENSILLLTSLYEPFGLVLPEAMSCGLPVVAFDCPYGPVDIIKDGVDGFLIRDRNIEEFVDRVCLLMENQELRVKMGKEGIVSSQRFDASFIMPLWKQLFKQYQ